MMNILNNLSVQVRLYLSVTLFIITLLAALSQAYFAIQANIDFAAKEKMGNVIQRPAAAILHDAALLRGELAIPRTEYMAGPDVGKYIKSISAHMDELKEAEAKVGDALEFTDEGLSSRDRSQLKFETVSEKWNALVKDLQSKPTAKSTSEAIVSFIADIRGIIAHSGDTSNLILDPDLDSYYLMDVTLLAMPQTIDRLGQIAEEFYPNLSQSLNAEDSGIATHGAVMSTMLSESDLARVIADMDVSFIEDQNFYGIYPGYKEQYTPLLDSYKETSQQVVDLLSKIGEKKTITLDEFNNSVSAAVMSSGKFIDAGFDHLDKLLDIRIADYKGQQTQALMISFAGLTVSMAFFIIVAMSISRPLSNLSSVVTKLSDADYDVEVPLRGTRSEIGRIASAVQVLKENSLETLRLRREQENIEKRSIEERRRMMHQLADQFDQQVGGTIKALSAAASELQDSSKAMESIARSTQDASASVAAASEETSANVSTVASATEEMTASAQEIAVQVSDVASKASEASGSASRTSERVNDLNGLVGNIGEVVTAIKDIAEQTNLLALNATIEAARAGEAGKGFAVVADEVKKLATETGKKTEEIENRIEQIRNATESSVKAMELIIRSVSDIDNLSAGAAAAVEEQNATISEITRNIAEVSMAAREVASVIGNVQRGASDTGESAQTLRNFSDNIASLSGNLEQAVQGFLNQVRNDNSSEKKDDLKIAAE
ncbi:MAG: HAMP domain-containing protein [Alphaproteobacteria bacterium]|nr:HAMP domain-containing protein [Alphaproteobacteria bacterium]